MRPVRSLLQHHLGHVTTRRGFLAGGVGVAAALAAYAGTGGRHQLEVVEQPMLLRDLPDRFVGFRIAQLSDIHFAEFTEAWFVREAVARINALQPDMVLLTGDFVSGHPLSHAFGRRQMPRCAEVLSELHCPMRYACFGNHDTAVGQALVRRELAQVGIPVLSNTAVPFDLGGDRIWLAAVDDPGTAHPDLFAAVPADPRAPVILMAHEPDYADFVRTHPRFAQIDLMLSGHTHGGQVRLPGLGPLVLPPMGRKYVEGLFRFGEMQLYVNRGLGTVDMPFRFHCPAEITVFTVGRA